jgi:hypothetical protein
VGAAHAQAFDGIARRNGGGHRIHHGKRRAGAGSVGKSVLVTWCEGRQQRINNAPEMPSATVNFNLGIYVSGAGRPFTG